MFRRREETAPPAPQSPTSERVTSVLGNGVVCKGNLGGSGGVRIEGGFEGDINLRGILVVGETGRVECQTLQANVVIIAGAVRGDIMAEKVEIRATGRVWGNVTTAAFATEEGAFLRGQIQMEEELNLEQDIPETDPGEVEEEQQEEIETETEAEVSESPKEEGEDDEEDTD